MKLWELSPKDCQLESGYTHMDSLLDEEGSSRE
jgi:hypothetical protein